MATTTSTIHGTTALLPETLLGAYRTMLLSRRLDDKEIQLKSQNRAYFQINGVGHEAAGAAAGLSLRPGYDWFFLYYRDRALCLQLGMTAYEMLLASVGSKEDSSSGGRQMPSHWAVPALHIVSMSSPVATQVLHATGAADASLYFRHVREAAELSRGFHADDVVLASLGDGGTSEGEFWESLNWSANAKLPLVYLVQDNAYAISVPTDVQTAGGSISRLFRDFPNLLTLECDGTDVTAAHEAMAQAVEHARKRRGPALVHAHVIRPYSHSLSDDERLYKPESLREEERKRDPVRRCAQFLEREGIATRQKLDEIEAGVEEEVRQATDKALAAAPPAPESLMLYIYSPAVDATSERFDRTPKFQGESKTMVDLINACLRDEMARDPRVVVFGEDVADCSHEDDLPRVKGKGGVFKVTLGLQRRFGSTRCFNTPLAEASIIGRAIGMAVRGLKPVAEIQFFDYIWPAMMQIRDELAMIRWRSNNSFSCPVVIRAPIGGYLAGGAMYHSQSGECLFTHIPGLRVVMPSTALDANGLLRTAIRSDDPVLFLEPKHLYRQTHNRSPYPGPDYMIPFGKAKVVREGADITVVTYGSVVVRAVQAAKMLEKEGIHLEIIDLRSLQPYDWELISTSVTKTSRALVAHEDSISWGYGAEIAARISEELFEFLDAPVRRLGGKDVFVPYHPVLEAAVLPQPGDVIRVARELAAF